MTMEEISTEVKKLVTQAKQGSLQSDQYQGGSFTISNLGMFGIDDFTAIKLEIETMPKDMKAEANGKLS